MNLVSNELSSRSAVSAISAISATPSTAVKPNIKAAYPSSHFFALSDSLHYRERQFELADHPLEAYFELIGERPSLMNGKPVSATWAIEDGWLYLTSLSATLRDGTVLNLGDLFPYAGEKVFAAWFTGTLKGFRDDVQSKLISADSDKRYPDLVLSVGVGRIRQSSMVHRGTTEQADAKRAANVIAFARKPAESLPPPTTSAGLVWDSKGGSAVYI
jgi:hypothetical protein